MNSHLFAAIGSALNYKERTSNYFSMDYIQNFSPISRWNLKLQRTGSFIQRSGRIRWPSAHATTAHSCQSPQIWLLTKVTATLVSMPVPPQRKLRRDSAEDGASLPHSFDSSNNGSPLIYCDPVPSKISQSRLPDKCTHRYTPAPPVTVRRLSEGCADA